MRAIGINTPRSNPFHAYFVRMRVSVPIPVIMSVSSGEEYGHFHRSCLPLLLSMSSAVHLFLRGSLCIGGVSLTIMSFDNKE